MSISIKTIWLHDKSIVLADQIIFSGNSFWTTLLMARILTPENFGIYASVLLFIYLDVNVINAIIMQPLQVTVSKIENTASYISFSFWLQLCLVLLLSAGIVGILSLNLTLFIVFNDLTYGIVWLAFGFIMQDYFRKLFLASGKLKCSLFVDTITATLQIGILVSAFFYRKYALIDIMYYLGLAYVPSIFIGVFLIQPKLYKRSLWKSYLFEHIHQAKWLLMTALVQWWSSNLFVVASGIFLGMKALGAFRLVQSVFGIFNVLLQTFENYVLPQASKLLKNSQAEAKLYIQQTGVKSTVLFGVLLLFVFVFSEYIVVLIGGSEYARYSFVVKGMAVLYFFIFLGYPIRIAIRMLILNKNFFTGYLISLGFSLLSFNFLLGTWGLIGAISGLIVSQLIVLSYWQYILMKKKFILWK